MPLQVAERPVVREHVEAVAGPLERAPRPVAAVGALADAGAQHRGPLGGAQATDRLEELALRQPRRLVQRRRDHLHLAVRVEVGQGDLGRGRGRRPPEQALRRGAGCLAPRVRQVAAPPHPAVLPVDPGEKGGNHLPQLGQHPVRARARASASGWARIRSSRASNACPDAKMPTFDRVAAGSSPRSVSSALARMTARYTPFGVAGGVRIATAEVLLRRLEPAAVGLEREVQGRDVPLAQGQSVELPGNEVLPPAAGPVGVWDVAGRLLEVRGQAPSLEHLRQQVRDALAGDVGGPELGHRVVAVLPEHALVEAVGPLDADRRLPDPARRNRVEELVEEEPPQRLRRARVAGEQRPLHDLGQVPQGEDVVVQVREVGGEGAPLVRREPLRRAASI